MSETRQVNALVDAMIDDLCYDLAGDQMRAMIEVDDKKLRDLLRDLSMPAALPVAAPSEAGDESEWTTVVKQDGTIARLDGWSELDEREDQWRTATKVLHRVGVTRQRAGVAVRQLARMVVALEAQLATPPTPQPGHAGGSLMTDAEWQERQLERALDEQQ